MKFYSISLFMCFIFFGCASHKEEFQLSKTINLDQKEELQAYFQIWVAGVQGGGSGINFFITKDLIKNPTEVYFRGKKESLVLNNNVYVAHFKTELNQEKDYVMDANAVKEHKNTLPLVDNFPFNIKDNEAIILSETNGKKEYILLKSIVKKPLLAYPSIKK
ncbi:hypothetical protein [Pseudofulvibacter geojedonensis]|uniref:Lipoprotein n=1 Tax=Pseudofulvibacter geojedonensis TaxID=1123758 RepID=A0ABW3I4Y1_9FLAO